MAPFSPNTPPAAGDPLDTLKQRLYSTRPIQEVTEPGLNTAPVQQTQTTGWAPPPAPKSKPVKKPGLPFAVKFLIGAGIFFVIAGSAAAVLIIFGGRSVSTDNVDVSIGGPTTISSGDTVSLAVTVHNGNPIAIQGATIDMMMPDGTRSADNQSVAFPNYSDTLGTINSGANSTVTVKAVLFGTEKQTLTIPVRVEYRTAGSNAVSVKEASYTVTITTSPVSLNVSTVGEAASGQPITVVVDVRSNATSVLNNIAVTGGTYPFGFTLTSATPKPASGSYFLLGTLQPGEDKKITITGMLTGQPTEQSTFSFIAGTANPDGLPSLGVTYTNNQTTVVIAQPLLGVTTTLNDQSDDTIVAPAGQSISGLLTWMNSLADPVANAQVQIAFSGNAFDPASVVAQNAFYQSSDHTILYSSDTDRSLALLQPGDSGNGAFQFAPKSASALSGVANPTITATITVSGTRTTSGAPISSTMTKTVEIGTSVALTAKALGSSAPTSNTPALYTIDWSAANTLNTVGAATVTTTLPQYVTFTNVTTPSDGSITYDASSRTVTWNVADLGPGQKRQASFQVSFLPSTSQDGDDPALTAESDFTGNDEFTGTPVTASAPAVVSGTVK